MIIKDKEYGEFDAYLVDDGTLDTVISVCLTDLIHNCVGRDDVTHEIRFDHDYVANFRDNTGAMTDEGFEILAKEAIEAYIEQYLV